MRNLPESGIKMRSLGVPAMVDLDIRFRMMDRFGDYVPSRKSRFPAD